MKGLRAVRSSQGLVGLGLAVTLIASGCGSPGVSHTRAEPSAAASSVATFATLTSAAEAKWQQALETFLSETGGSGSLATWRSDAVVYLRACLVYQRDGFKALGKIAQSARPAMLRYLDALQSANALVVEMGKATSTSSFDILSVKYGVAVEAALGPSSGQATPSPTQTSTPPPTPTPSATPTPRPTPMAAIGTPVSGGGITFEVDSAQVVPAPYFQANPPGYVTVAIEVSLTNHGTASPNVSSLLDFKILGSQGQTYGQVILGSGPTAPNGTLAPGQEITGDIGYQLPPGAYTVAYTPFGLTALPPVSIGNIS